MTYFDQVYKQLFGDKSPKQKLISHELIKRSPSYWHGYNEHVKSPEFISLIESIYSSYLLKQQKIEMKPLVHILASEYANGLAISLNETMDANEFTYLFDWLKEQMVNLDYQITNSDCIIQDKGTYIESKEKHYLKPHVGKGELLNQQFGNVLIEYIKIDNHPNYIKLTANIYSDRKYTKAEKFEKLAEYLLFESLK